MSYNKMMKWQRTHRKGTKQPVIMHTNSGFTPSISFLDDYFEYRTLSESKGVEPLECEQYYRLPSFNKIELHQQLINQQ